MPLAWGEINSCIHRGVPLAWGRTVQLRVSAKPHYLDHQVCANMAAKTLIYEAIM